MKSPLNTFAVGETLTTRSVGDSNCVWKFTVVARTEKFVTLAEHGGKTARVGVKIDALTGTEFALPFGSYSMAPSVRPGRCADAPSPRKAHHG